MTPSRTGRRALALTVAAISLIASACGSDSDDAADDSSTTAEASAGATEATGAASDSTAASDDTTPADDEATDTTSGGGTTADAATNTTAANSDLDTQLPPLTDDPIEISFESYNFLAAGASADTINGLLDEFEEQYPNISIERRSPSSISALYDSIQQQLIAGDPPSLSQLGFSMDFIANDLGAPSWQSIVGEDTMSAYFDGSLYGQFPVHPNAAPLGDYDGETIVMPWVFSTPTLFFNRDIFEAAGLDPDNPPQTWDDVAAAATTITENTDYEGMYISCTGPSSGGWCWEGILRSNGSIPISDDFSTLSFDDPAAVEVNEVFQGYVDAGIHPNISEADSQDLFLRGELGMYMNSSALTGAALQGASTNEWTLDATGLPAWGDKEIAPTNSGSGLVLFAQDPMEQRAAWELAKFLTSDHAYVKITSGIGYLPLRTGVVEVEGDDGLAGWLAENPFLQTNLDQLDQLVPYRVPPGANGQQIMQLWLDATNDVMFNGSDAQSTLTEAQNRSVELMP